MVPTAKHRAPTVEIGVSIVSGDLGTGPTEAKETEVPRKMTTDLDLCSELEINELKLTQSGYLTCFFITSLYFLALVLSKFQLSTKSLQNKICLKGPIIVPHCPNFEQSNHLKGDEKLLKILGFSLKLLG